MKKDRQLQCLKKWGRYKNPHSQGLKHGLFDILLWKTGFYKESFFQLPPQDFLGTLKESCIDPKKPSVVWINHSSFLIKIANFYLLTDPMWSKKCSPISLFGPKRLHFPPFSIDDLSKVDVVLISHNHYDHLDKKTISKLFQQFPKILWVVPKGVKKWFLKKKIKNVTELSWWENISFADLSISAVPAQHFSGRNVLDYNQSLWAGYVVEHQKEKKIFYFAGDTGYNEYDFKNIGKKWKTMDLSLIPIGCYLPRKFMMPIHISPYDAVKIHKEVGSCFSIGMHWKTFHISDEPVLLPPYDLFLAMKKEKLDPRSFIAIEPGVYVNW